MHQLALITAIRKIGMNVEMSVFDDILFKTDILYIIDNILSCNNSDEEEYRFLRQEAIWITINLVMASEQGVQYILASCFIGNELSEENLKEDFERGTSSILSNINGIAKQIITDNCEDIQLLNLIFFLFANIVHTGKPYAEKVVKET